MWRECEPLRVIGSLSRREDRFIRAPPRPRGLTCLKRQTRLDSATGLGYRPRVAFAWNVAGAQRFRGAAGNEAALWRPQRGVVVTRVIGHADLPLLQFYALHAEVEMQNGPLRVFHDWSAMTGYDPDARDELKRWGKLHNRDFAGVRYLVRSKVVVMLISVAALSLGRDLDATTDPAVFMRHLDAALGAR